MRVPAALLGLAVFYVAVVGIDFDVTPQGEEIAAKLGATLGREVRFTGPMRLEVSVRPKLRVGGLHVANPGGFGNDDFASLGEARLALNLWPLLWGHLRVEELAGSDAHLRLQVRKDGANNWTLRRRADSAATDAQSTSAAPETLTRLDIKRITVQRLDVQYVGGDGKGHYFNLNSLVARVPSGEPVSVSMKGMVEKTFPYELEFTGGPLAELIGTGQPWPIDLSLHFLSSRLTLKGTLSGNSGNLHFALASKDLTELERLLQARLPPVGETRIAGDVSFAPGRVGLAHLNGNMGKTTLAGALDVDYGSPRPLVAGALSLPILDLRPFLTGKPAEDEPSAQSLAEFYRDLAQATFDLRLLNQTDADLTLRVGTWLNTPGGVHDAVLQVKLDHGRLTMPIRATMADATLSGRALVDARKSPARFEVALGARDSNIGSLAGLLVGAPGVKGRLGRFDLRITARGNRGSELMESLVVQLGAERAELSYGNRAGARPVRFSLDHFAVELPAGKPLHGEAHGTLVDNPFTMSLRGASLTEILQEANAAIDFTLQAGHANAQVHAVLQPPAEDSGSEVRFSLDAPHSSEIASWLGVTPDADVPASLRGTFHARAHGWLLSGLAFQLGRSRLSAEVEQSVTSNKPLIRLSLGSELIDLDQLKSLLPDAPASAPAPAAAPTASIVDIPILPQGINLTDADIAVRIQKVATQSPFTVRNLRFDGRIRDGMMPASPFAANVANTDFTGALLIDLRTQQPRATLWLGADDMNIGAILHRLDIAPNAEAYVDHLRLYMDLRSSRLGQLVAQSELSVSFDGGHLDLRDPNTGGVMHIALRSGELKSTAGTPVHLDLDGALDKAPVKIHIETATAADLLNPERSIPFQLNVASSGTTLRLSGDVDRPFSRQDVQLALELGGDRFDSLDPLLHASLPPWGPWSVSGKFHMSQAGYEVSSLQLQVGTSQLKGHGKLDTRVTPPRLDFELAAPTIQIDDFRFGNWSPEKPPPAASKAASERPGEPGVTAEQLLSREVLRRQNAYLLVRVDQVLSGKDVLGNGALAFQLQDGRADIGPVVVSTPGGAAMFRLDYEPRANDVVLNLRAGASHFDYGVLARRMDRKSDMRGTFDLDVALSAQAKSLSELLRYGRGHVDFALWPENMKSGLLDLWAVNVLVALLPAVDSSSESKVNCAIGRFTLQDGKLSDKHILIDTTRMRVSGKGNADFATEQIRFYMQPRAKTPQFLSFPLPVEVTGSFREFSVGVRAGDVLQVAGEFVTSVFWVPLQSLFGKPLPADGKDVCRLE